MGPDGNPATFVATAQPLAFTWMQGHGSILIQLIILCLEICQTYECIPKILNTNKTQLPTSPLSRSLEYQEEGEGDLDAV